MLARAALFRGPKQPLDLKAIARPTPGEGEVLLRISACTLCRSDLHTHAGRRTEPTPSVLGHEIVGRIEAFGPGTVQTDSMGTSVQIGDRVSPSVAISCGGCFSCQHELEQKCSQLRKYGHLAVDEERPWFGGLADYLLLPPGSHWFRVPNNIPDSVAASANCATATVAAIVRTAGDLVGSTVLVLGAGVLGLTACAMAKSGGAARVIVCDPNAESRARSLNFGADTATTPDECQSHTESQTEGRGADVAVEVSGSANACAAALNAVRIGGSVIFAGTVSPVGTIPLDPEKLVRRMLTLRGVHNYRPRDLQSALEFLANDGQRYPFASLVAETFALEQAELAFQRGHELPGQRVLVRMTENET